MRPIVPLITGIGIAVVAARDLWRYTHGATWISQGGTPHGTIIGKAIGERHVAAWVAQSMLRHPTWVITTVRAEAAARQMENALFYGGDTQFARKIRIGYDNGPDAFRHTFGSALIVYRLMRERGVDAARAVQFLHQAGDAHERDSLLERFSQLHDTYSSAMDTFNNHVGASIAVEMAARHAQGGVSQGVGEQLLRTAVISAIASGHTQVLDTIESPPRRSRPEDICVVDEHGMPLRAADGTIMLRDHPPDAPGFPSPIVNGRVDLHHAFVRMR